MQGKCASYRTYSVKWFLVKHLEIPSIFDIFMVFDFGQGPMFGALLLPINNNNKFYKQKCQQLEMVIVC